MGTWKLEVLKMAVYITFPVSMFHIFNNPEYFEEAVIKTKREMCPPEDAGSKEAIKEMKARLRRRRELEIEKEFMSLK